MQPEILDKIRSEYIYQNLGSFQSPNLAKICRTYEVDPDDVYPICKEEEWLEERLSAQKTFRESTNDAVESAILAQGIDLGARIMELLQTTAIKVDTMESLVDKQLLDKLEDVEAPMSTKDLLALKKLISSDKVTIVKHLMDIVKMIEERNKRNLGDDDNQIAETAKKMMEIMRNSSSIDPVVWQSATHEQLTKQKSSLSVVSETERVSLFEQLDSQNVENE